MQAESEPDELIDAWTLTGNDWDLIANKAGVTRLGFAVMLKFYEIEGRFPAYPQEVPPAAISYLGSLVKVDPALFAKYSWAGRSIKYHRSQIRKVYRTRPPTEDDEDRWAQWLAAELCPAETNRDRLAAALRWRCRSEKVEPPSTGQVERVVASAGRRFDDDFAATAAGRLGPVVCGRLEDLLSRPNVLAELKSDPGPLGLDTLLAEIGKLSMVRALGLTEAVFGDASDRIVAAWRARAARMYPSDFADCPEPVRYALLAALCWTRQAELVDGLVELLIGLIHRINARAERRVEKELIGELANVPGKRGIFTKIIDAALERPDDTVREAVYPVVPGGVKTLSALARELKATERAVAERVRYQLRGSYSHYYRRMLAPLLAALEFRCNNSAYRPVMDAIDLLARYAGADSDQRLYAAGEKVPVDGVVPKAWLDGVVDDDGRVERIPYELCVLIAVRDALRRREVYVQGAGRWKDPDEDLPGDFEANRDVHYAELGKPLDAAEFIGGLRKRLGEGLTRLDTALARGTSGGVRIITRQGSPWVSVPKLDKLPAPRNLGALKAEVQRRWGTIDLLDILKDTAFITGFTDSFTSVASREVLDHATLNRRLLLVLFALGTNMGIRQMAITGEHGVGEAELRHVRATYVTRENLRAAITTVVNATLEARDPAWWGQATSTASDSKRFASWDSNLMTEFHARIRRDRLPADIRHLHRPVLPLHPLRGLGGGVHPGLAAGQRVRRPARPDPCRYPRPEPARLRARGVARVRAAAEDTELARPELLPAGRHDEVRAHRRAVRRQRDRLGVDREALAGPAAGRDLHPGRPAVLGDAAATPGQPLASQSAVQGAEGARPRHPHDHAASLSVGAGAARPDRRDHQPDRAVPQLRPVPDDRWTADRPQRPGLSGAGGEVQ